MLEDEIAYAMTTVELDNSFSRKIRHVKYEIIKDVEWNKITYFTIGFETQGKILSYSIEKNIPDATAILIKLFSAENDLATLAHLVSKAARIAKKILLYMKLYR